MSDKKPTSKSIGGKKAKTVPVGPAKEGTQVVKGKVKGQGEVKPANLARVDEKTANLAKGHGEGAETFKEGVNAAKAAEGFDAAYAAGRRASETGAKGVPPAEYNGIEVRAWYEGYKSHANPNAEGQVKGIDKGYRDKY